MLSLSWKQAEFSDFARCSGHPVAIDIETTGLDWWKDSVIGIGVYCPEAGVEAYMPVESQKQLDTVRQIMMAWSASTLMISHNIKFELQFLGIPSWQMEWKLADTMVMAHLLNSRDNKSLDALERKYLGTSSKEQYIMLAQEGAEGNSSNGSKRKRKRVHEWKIDEIAAYCVNDCRITFKLYNVLLQELRQWDLEKLFKMEMRFIRLLQESERRGFLLDFDFLQRAEDNLRRINRELEQSLYDSVGYEFNPRSSKQLSEALYDGMGIERPEDPFPNSKFSGRGLYNSTCTSTTLLVRHKHPLADLIIGWRETAKLLSTIKNWRKVADNNGYVHTNFNITGTVTGRISSSKPNVQNVPSAFRAALQTLVQDFSVLERQDFFNLRLAFLPPPGYTLISGDYKQMEMRMFGLLARDPLMLQALASGADIHAFIAEKIWGSGDPMHREWAKVAAFGLIYGMTVGSLEFRFNLPREQAIKIAEEYWNTFPAIQPWLFGVTDIAKQRKWLRMWSKRLWWRKDDPLYAYQAANALIQGGCSDVLRVASMRVHRRLKNEIGQEPFIISYVHDEIIVAVPDEPDLVAKVEAIMKEEMPVPDLFNLPWIISIKRGNSYGAIE